MTYLEIVNNILKRLRERTVSTVDENTYSALVGVLVNDAKREVEQAWKWSALRTTLTAGTTTGIFQYALVGSNSNMEMLSVLNDTTDVVMTYKSQREMTDLFLLRPVKTGEPLYYGYNGTDTNGDTVVDIYPVPDAEYFIRYNAVVRQPELTDDADVLNIPIQPVLMLAYAKAVEERGEDGGVGTQSAYIAATSAIADAVSLDAETKHPEELIWTSE